MTNTVTNSPTNTSTQTATNSPTVTPTNTATQTATNTVTSTATNTATITPTSTTSSIPIQTSTITNTPTSTPTVINNFSLSANVFNPINGVTLQVRYGVSQAGMVDVAVYNIAGERVRQLASGNAGMGNYTAAWDGKDDRGQIAASGIYIVEINETYHRQLLKLLVVK